MENPPDGVAPPPADWDPPADDNPDDSGDPQCSDGLDNDGDGYTDEDDPRCHWDGDATNPGSYTPNDDLESPVDSPLPQCGDSLDNDGDGYTDIADPECHTDNDPDSDGDGVPDNNDGSFDPTGDNESDRVTPGESGSTVCEDGGLGNIAVDTTPPGQGTSATWTAPNCPVAGLVCPIDVTVSGPGGSTSRTTNISVARSGEVSAEVRDTTGGVDCATAPLYTEEISVALTGPVNTTEQITDGTYSFVCLPNGDYNVSIGLPSGYQMSEGSNTIARTVANDVPPVARFCISRGEPWFQVTTGDVRMSGIVNPIPGGLFGALGENTEAPATSLYPGIFHSTQFTTEIDGGGEASARNWQVNREYDYNDLTKNRNGTVAYSFYVSRARQEGIPITTLQSSTFDPLEIAESGVYEYPGPLTISDYSVSPGQRVVLLSPDDITITGEISAPAGTLLIIASSEDVIIDAGVGTATLTDASPQIEAIISAEGSVILAGDGCDAGTPDLRLNVGGALIANALKPFTTGGTGTVQNNRSLCTDDNLYPSFFVAARLDFLTQMTDFYKAAYTKWREVRP